MIKYKDPYKELNDAVNDLISEILKQIRKDRNKLLGWTNKQLRRFRNATK